MNRTRHHRRRSPTRSREVPAEIHLDLDRLFPTGEGQTDAVSPQLAAGSGARCVSGLCIGSRRLGASGPVLSSELAGAKQETHRRQRRRRRRCRAGRPRRRTAYWFAWFSSRGEATTVASRFAVSRGGDEDEPFLTTRNRPEGKPEMPYECAGGGVSSSPLLLPHLTLLLRPAALRFQQLPSPLAAQASAAAAGPPDAAHLLLCWPAPLPAKQPLLQLISRRGSSASRLRSPLAAGRLRDGSHEQPSRRLRMTP